MLKSLACVNKQAKFPKPQLCLVQLLFVTPLTSSTPGFPVLRHLLKFAQTRVH